MDRYPEFTFAFSQPQLFAFVKEHYPQLFERVREKVKSGQFELVGNTWVEMDTNVPSGESLIRQILYGRQFFLKEFGRASDVFWMPDVFGYTWALPQIIKRSGMKYFYTSKLIGNDDNRFPYSLFLWQGADGTRIPAYLQRLNYNGFLGAEALSSIYQRFDQKAVLDEAFMTFGFGDGGGGPTRGMLENSMRLEKGVAGLPTVRQCFARTYFEELDKRVSGNKRLPVWEGELYFEYHRGTYTSMARNKRGNRKTELGLMDLELLSVLAAPQLPYPVEALDSLWKNTLLNQFHDILPGTAIHEVYEQTKKEYDAMAETISALSADRMQVLAPQGEGITVFNTTGKTRSDIVVLENCTANALSDGKNTYPVQQTENGAVAFLPDLPPKGYKCFAPVEAGSFENTLHIDGSTITTPFYTVEFDESGLITRLYDRKNDRETVQPGKYANLMRMYEDKPIYYDNWDIDIYYTEKDWDVTELTSLRWTDVGAVSATLELERCVSSSLIRQKIRFYANSRRIDFETYVDWHEHQHLLKVHFPVDVHTDEATFEIQFGNLKRKVHTNTSWDVARFESCGQKWMDLSEGHYGVSLLNDCKYGHSVKDGCIALTLIKSGIEPNPVTDQEEHFFTYALYPHGGDWREGGTVQEAYRLNQPALCVRGAGETPTYSLAATEHPNVMLETVKRAEDGDGWIVRLYETDNARTASALRWSRPVSSVEECNCIEEPVAPAACENGRIPFVIKPYEIKTFRIREKEEV